MRKVYMNFATTTLPPDSDAYKAPKTTNCPRRVMLRLRPFTIYILAMNNVPYVYICYYMGPKHTATLYHLSAGYIICWVYMCNVTLRSL